MSRMSPLEIIETQNKIIKKQADIIDSLFTRLSLLCDDFPELNDMREAAQRSKEVAEW